ncbi:MAG: DUF4340 domain-containing protein [Candidatus Binatia bacterium]|nr:DUF4340 domain-containing protein [Candidatus Binatia bacterium]
MSSALRSVVSLVVIAASALATWVAVGLQPPPPLPPGEQVESVFGFDTDAVVGISVRTWQGALRAVRSDGHWQVVILELAPQVAPSESVPPPGQAAIDAAMDVLVRDVVGLPEVNSFESAAPLAEFGLDTPDASISLTLASGATTTLEIGARTTSAAGLYARLRSSPEILQIGGLLLTQTRTAFFHLRGLGGDVG